MKTILIPAILAILLQGQEIPKHPDHLKYKDLTFKVPDASSMRVELKNGMVVYVLEDRTLPKIDMSIQLRAGSFWEPAGKEGLAGMTGAIMRTGGTKTRKPDDVDDTLEFLSAQLGVSIGDTSGTAGLSLLSKDLDEGLALLVDVLAHPDFKQEKIDLFKAQRLNQLKARNDSTGAIEGRETNHLFYGDYPVNSHMTSTSLASITREDLQQYHERFIHPSTMIMAVAGDFDRAQLIPKLEGAFGNWPTKTAEKVKVPPATHAPKPGVYLVHKEGANINQGRVTIGHMGIDLAHPDAFAIRIMTYIFGAGGFTSHLVANVRTDKGLAYDVRADYRPGIVFTGTFRMVYQSKSESCLYAAKLCLEEMEAMQKVPVTDEELKGAISFYLDAFPGLFFSTPIQTVSTFAAAEFNGYPKDYYQVYRDKIAAVTVKDVQRVAREHMKRDKLLFVFVGNTGAIRGGDGKNKIAIEEFGPVTEIPLPDPLTLKRPDKK